MSIIVKTDILETI